MSTDFFLKLSVWAIPLLLAITLHEAAHGWAAWKLGDNTAKQLGRVSFNPLVHVDLFGTILLPLMMFLSNVPFLFGYAKPVPVNFRNLRNPKRDMIWVALAGPAANIFLVLVGALLARALPIVPDFAYGWLYANLNTLVFANAIIAIFNLLPLPPLDGGRVMIGILPDSLSRKFARIEPYGMMILIMLLLLQSVLKINILYAIIGPPIFFIIDLANQITPIFYMG